MPQPKKARLRAFFEGGFLGSVSHGFGLGRQEAKSLIFTGVLRARKPTPA